MKLTDEQKNKLIGAYLSSPCSMKDGMQNVVDCLIPLINNESKTHRVVEAPEGYEFTGKLINIHDIGYDTHRLLALCMKPIPKPCPAPVLEPILSRMRVDDRYPRGYKIPDGWQAVYQTVAWLKANCFTHCLLISEYQPASEVATIEAANFNSDQWAIIGLKKWEGE